jgi:hypothetical protein
MAFTAHLHPRRMAAEGRKGTQAAGEHDDLSGKVALSQNTKNRCLDVRDVAQ